MNSRKNPVNFQGIIGAVKNCKQKRKQRPNYKQSDVTGVANYSSI